MVFICKRGKKRNIDVRNAKKIFCCICDSIGFSFYLDSDRIIHDNWINIY